MELVEHALVALAIQVFVGLSTKNWWAGALLACGYFIGRELAQAEYRWIEAFGGGLRANAPWWAPIDLRVWTKADQFADIIGPLVATATLALVMRRKGQRSRHRHPS
ncbi:hypothetical protein [Qipengyuania qiaonensis]|uniref:DUF2809 domain-containing protein n=1 Tax=Qipengyuania qiaonensis TaxID=2867240 RepID=A0ABS7J7D7_9SPHN|nr:hypothetical protein [Qipengyuania qiaonensis]MBX7481999.1 hypothetical protein [Qipengyuania qiaonensis]